MADGLTFKAEGFEELFRNISFFHKFLAPERHSCQKVGVNILMRRMFFFLLLLLWCRGLALLWMWTCAWKSRGLQFEDAES